MNKVIEKIDKYLNEGKGDDKEYQAFFNKMLKKFNVTSPSQLKGDKKKEFFKAVEDGWTKEDPKTDDKDE